MRRQLTLPGSCHRPEPDPSQQTLHLHIIAMAKGGA